MKRLRARIFRGRHYKLQALLFAMVGVCFALLFYGLVTYPDAPYKFCQAGHYCGKSGKPYSYQTYRDHQRWETWLFVCWPFGMLAGFGLGKLRKAAPEAA